MEKGNNSKVLSEISHKSVSEIYTRQEREGRTDVGMYIGGPRGAR